MMIGSFVLFVLVLVEVGFMTFSLMKKSDLKKEKSITRVVLFAVFLILVISPIIDWNCKWFMLGLFLGIQALLGILFIVRKKENYATKKSKIIFTSLNRVFLICMLVLPSIILPQYDPINPTGEYSVVICYNVK